MDLNAPLGNKKQTRRRRPFVLLTALLGLSVVSGAGAYLYRADPHGGEPFASALIPPPPPPAPARRASLSDAPDQMTTGSIAPRPASNDNVQIENGVRVVSPRTDVPASTQSGPFVIDVSKALDDAARHRAKSPNAAALVAPNAGEIRPQVAIFVSGLGLGAASTRTVTELMPPAVTFAFVASAGNLADSLAAARAKGHEILLQIPMEKGDAPHTIHVDEPPAAIAQDMSWLLSRFDGYVGVTNLLGAHVTTSQSTMSAVLRSVAQRGLFYLDDGTARGSQAAAVAPSVGARVVQADVVLDATADPNLVRANLDRLVAIARVKGAAIGMATSFSDHVATIARFAADLDARGVTLVPVSTVVNRTTNLMTKR